LKLSHTLWKKSGGRETLKVSAKFVHILTFLELKTILLDLDETLIHSEEWVRGKKYDLEVEIDVEDGKKDVSKK
jgi:hypothetical protein